MKDFIGVESSVSILKFQLLKQRALIFKKIVIPYLDMEQHGLSLFRGQLAAELEWLLEKGIIFKPKINEERLEKETRLVEDDLDWLRRKLSRDDLDSMDSLD